MFQVYEKKTNKPVQVYDVQRDKCGYPMFLIRQGNQWIYRSAKHYSTEQKRDKDTIKRIMCEHEYEAIRAMYPRVKYRCKKCGHEYTW